MVVPKFEESLINTMVMEEGRLKTLKALAKSYIRQDIHENDINRDPWAAEFVKGKGSGLILLLHGKPGVGKTCTAGVSTDHFLHTLRLAICKARGSSPDRWSTARWFS